SGETQDNLSDGLDQSLIDKALLEEAAHDRKHQQQNLLLVLNQAIEQLKPPRESMLRQYYCEGLKQKEIANQLGINQGTVARRLNSTRETLLASLVKWRQDIAPEDVTPDAITDISNALELWLNSSFCEE
ncbi:MAG: sigma-70 family RNA polymerase sigma factor, partial [Cyanobacteria bacterium J06649_4]